MTDNINTIDEQPEEGAAYLQPAKPSTASAEGETTIQDGSDKDLMAEVLARFWQQNGRQGRITKMLKESFINGALWMRERLAAQPSPADEQDAIWSKIYEANEDETSYGILEYIKQHYILIRKP
jgi:hypothetical protein